MSSVQTVAWKRGYHGKVKAAKAFSELEKIKGNNGGVLTAGIVVQKAKAKRSPIHDAFEWSDEVAGHEYRLEQARRMMRSIEVVYAEAPQVAPQRHYVAVSEPPKMDAPERKVYRTTEEVLQDPVARDELLGQAIRDALTYRKKYHALSELAGVFVALDDFVTNNRTV